MVYGRHLRTLLVGEGDFSFAVALACDVGSAENMVATSHDDLRTLGTKYPDKAEGNIGMLKKLGIRGVLHDIDARELHQSKRLKALSDRFDRVIFNFPHVGGGTLEAVEENRTLLIDFLISAAQVLDPRSGCVLITLRNSPFYLSWDVPSLENRVAPLRFAGSEPFDARRFLNYVPVRTDPSRARGEAPDS
eukprot:CAMPEP_0119147126 /NCGR_PEP_ID=MMETSP1310-20130426/39906_1 /TAXON_ID=464262 /ORGANISM="Genus nov. species nov., Strain RCC2339" /LENGTH=190 /DNA_ID=CAMNT_0007139067 /DNA_START=44 /DNA_END=612 /DNA_ORIENTATION=-